MVLTKGEPSALKSQALDGIESDRIVDFFRLEPGG